MPIYEYHCPKCKATYELRQGFDAETTQKCEECGKGIAKRVLYAPPVVFKGSGWYVTDSKSRSAAVADSKTEGEAAPSSSATDGDSKSGDKNQSEGTPKLQTKAKPEPAVKSEGKANSDAAAAS